MPFGAKNSMTRARQHSGRCTPGRRPKERRGVRRQMRDGRGPTGAPSKKKSKASLTWNHRQHPRTRLRSRPGAPAGVGEGSWQGPSGASGRVAAEWHCRGPAQKAHP